MLVMKLMRFKILYSRAKFGTAPKNEALGIWLGGCWEVCWADCPLLAGWGIFPCTGGVGCCCCCCGCCCCWAGGGAAWFWGDVGFCNIFKRQVGHVCWRWNHDRKQAAWKIWLHGSFLAPAIYYSTDKNYFEIYWSKRIKHYLNSFLPDK